MAEITLAKTIKIAAVLSAVVFALPASVAEAQSFKKGFNNSGRDCKVIRTCQFRRGGTFRGCISTYSCRVCRFVPSRCSIAGRKSKSCSKVRCTWG